MADRKEWHAFVGMLEGAYGAGARVVLYRAPVFASVEGSSLLSVPVQALHERELVDGLMDESGGDLGTMYVPGGGGNGGNEGGNNGGA